MGKTSCKLLMAKSHTSGSTAIFFTGALRLVNDIANVHMENKGKEIFNTISIEFADFLFAYKIIQASAVDILKIEA